MPLLLLSTTCVDPTHVELVFDQQVVLAQVVRDPLEWRIVPSDLTLAIEPAVLSVHEDGDTVVVTTTEHTNLGSYSVRVPQQVFGTPSGDRNLGGDVPYTGTGVRPTVSSVAQLDSRTLEVFFSEAMLEADALEPTLYLLDNGLEAQSVEKITDLVYRVTMSASSTGATITVTCAGMRDQSLNTIA